MSTFLSLHPLLSSLSRQCSVITVQRVRMTLLRLILWTCSASCLIHSLPTSSCSSHLLSSCPPMLWYALGPVIAKFGIEFMTWSSQSSCLSVRFGGSCRDRIPSWNFTELSWARIWMRFIVICALFPLSWARLEVFETVVTLLVATHEWNLPFSRTHFLRRLNYK